MAPQYSLGSGRWCYHSLRLETQEQRQVLARSSKEITSLSSGLQTSSGDGPQEADMLSASLGLPELEIKFLSR